MRPVNPADPMSVTPGFLTQAPITSEPTTPGSVGGTEKGRR